MSFAKGLKTARLTAGLTQAQLGERIGVANTTISGYEKGTSEASEDKIRALMEVLGVDANTLFGWGECSAITPQEERIGRAYGRATPPVQRTVEVALEPFLDIISGSGTDEESEVKKAKAHVQLSEQAAAAGTGVWLDSESFCTILVDADMLPRGVEFAVPVAGDSMEPRYYDGDILLVAPNKEVLLGDIGVFVMGGQGYVKQLGDGVLHSLNAAYEDMDISEDIRCSGKVVGTLSPLDIEYAD